MIDGSGTINPAALNTPGNFPSTQSTPLGENACSSLGDSRKGAQLSFAKRDPRSYVELRCRRLISANMS